MDELVAKLGMDPVELRRFHDTMMDPTDGKPYSSRSLMQCYDEAAKAFGWSARKAQPGSMWDGDWLVGWGCATACYPTHIGTATARVRLEVSDRQGEAIAGADIGSIKNGKPAR
jgi:xanthine dehydrogenase YagR molybdenum-binding subunit